VSTPCVLSDTLGRRRRKKGPRFPRDGRRPGGDGHLLPPAHEGRFQRRGAAQADGDVGLDDLVEAHRLHDQLLVRRRGKVRDEELSLDVGGRPARALQVRGGDLHRCPGDGVALGVHHAARDGARVALGEDGPREGQGDHQDRRASDSPLHAVSSFPLQIKTRDGRAVSPRAPRVKPPLWPCQLKVCLFRHSMGEVPPGWRRSRPPAGPVPGWRRRCAPRPVPTR